MGAHVFAAVGGYVVVHQVARQQDEVGFFRFHDGGEAVELAAADEDAQMQVGGGGDAQGSGEFFIDDYALVAHDGGVGVVQPQAEQGGDKEGGEQAQGAGEAGLRQQAAQQQVQQEGGERGIHDEQQQHHPEGHNAEDEMPQLQQQAGEEAV